MGARALIVDDHDIVRAGLCKLLLGGQYISSVTEANSGELALQYIKDKTFDVVIMDINMTGLDGIQTTAIINKMAPDIKIIILSIHRTEPFISHSFNAGAKAYLSKACAPEELETAIDKVINGHCYLSKDISQHIALSKIGNEQHTLTSLTDREHELFVLLAKGVSMVSAAHEMNISPKTGYIHRDRLMKKLGVTNLIELADLARRLDISS